MKYFVIMLIFSLFASEAKSAEPIIQVQPLPSGSQLEMYEDSEALFAMKMMEYYRAAVILEAQLLMMGIEPANPISAPTFDEMQDMDTRTLRRYYMQALGMLKQVQQSPDGFYHQKLEELRARVEQMNKNNFILQEQIHLQNLDLLSSDFYRNRYRELIKHNDSLRVEIDKMILEHNKEMWKYHNNLRQLLVDGKSIPILSISAAGAFWDFRSDDISTDISPSVMINFNPSPIFGFGRIIDIWAEYSYPSIESKRATHSFNSINEYKTDIYSTGMNLIVPLSEIMKIEGFNLAIKTGYGFFWGNSRMPNVNISSSKWQGQMIRLEIGADNFDRLFFPMGVYISYNFYNYSKELTFPTWNEKMNLGKPWVNSLQLGLRFALWQSASPIIN